VATPQQGEREEDRMPLSEAMVLVVVVVMVVVVLLVVVVALPTAQ